MISSKQTSPVVSRHIPKDFKFHQQFCENLISSTALSVAYCCMVLGKFVVGISSLFLKVLSLVQYVQYVSENSVRISQNQLSYF